MGAGAEGRFSTTAAAEAVGIVSVSCCLLIQGSSMPFSLGRGRTVSIVVLGGLILVLVVEGIRV